MRDTLRVESPASITRSVRARYVVTAIASLVLVGAAAAGPAEASSPRHAPPAASAPGWLSEINYYRHAAGIPAVTANRAWIQGIKNHLRYMADTPPKYLTGQYASLHTENPKSPYYTQSGAREAAASDLYEGAVGYTPEDLITGWLSAPFHAIGMLRVDLRQVAFASNSSTGDAGLDVLSGLTGVAPHRLVRFPGPGSTTPLLTYGGVEEPNPLQTCNWTEARAYGLPLIALLTTEPEKHLTATLRASNGTVESTAKGSLCMLDEHHYHSTDKVYGPTGLAILQYDQAVILIPLHPLVKAKYHVTISQPGQPDITWSFSAAPRSTH
jgi:Cysteine-rich secretory protein family